MSKKQQNLFLILLVFLVWGGISTYHYTCNIKGFCQNKVVKNTTTEKEEVVENNIEEDNNEDYYNNLRKEDYTKRIITSDKKIIIKDSDIESEEIVSEDKITIKCYTYINSYIKPNSNNIPEEVKKLKNFLNIYNENQDLDINYGIYDQNSVDKLVEFQRKNNLDTDGVVGKNTLKLINAIYCAKNYKK